MDWAISSRKLLWHYVCSEHIYLLFELSMSFNNRHIATNLFNQFQVLSEFIRIEDSISFFNKWNFPLIFSLSLSRIYSNSKIRKKRQSKKNGIWFSTQTIANRLKTLEKCFVYQKICRCLFDLDQLLKKMNK